MRLGDLLLQEKAITEEHLQKALDYQKENPEVRIGAALVKLDLLDMKTLVGTLAKQQPLIAEGEIHSKEVAPKVSQALKLGEILLKQKVVTPEQLREAVNYQQGHPEVMFGQALINLGFTNEEIILGTLQKQKEAEQVSVPPEQGKVAMKLGEMLLTENTITEEQLRQALRFQKEYAGTMLGQALTELNFVSKKGISEALRRMRQED